MVNVFIDGPGPRSIGAKTGGGVGWAIGQGLLAGGAALALGIASMAGLGGLLSFASSSSYSSSYSEYVEAPAEAPADAYGDPYAPSASVAYPDPYAVPADPYAEAAPPSYEDPYASEVATPPAAPALSEAEIEAARARGAEAAAEASSFMSISVFDVLRSADPFIWIHPFLFGVLISLALRMENIAWAWVAGVSAFLFGPISQLSMTFVGIAATQTSSIAVIAPSLLQALLMSAISASLIAICAVLAGGKKA